MKCPLPQCDAGCDTRYCYGYQEGSTFGVPVSGPDMTRCFWNSTVNTSYVNCSVSESASNVYLDENMSEEFLAIYPDYEYGQCLTEWIDDGAI